jgi:hypothetical protein
MWDSNREELNPDLVLRLSSDRAEVIQGLVPVSGITWLYGASMSYKTFAAMSMAVQVSNKAPWIGRSTAYSKVLYVGAEGGAALHLRRAAAETAAGHTGPLFVVQERPQLDTPVGAARLQGIIEGLTGANCSRDVMSSAEQYALDDAIVTYGTGEDFQKTITGAGLLCIVDTYSQTAAGDDKTNVSAYIKALRDIIECSAEGGDVISFLVVDHATKAGSSYMGSVAKLNDVDSQLEVLRTGDNRATVYQRKVKDGVESAPVHLELVPFVFEQYKDAYGAALTTLVVQDGSKSGKAADGKASVLLGVLKAQGGDVSEIGLRAAFAAHGSNEGIKADSVSKAYRRARDSLMDSGIVTDTTGSITLV